MIRGGACRTSSTVDSSFDLERLNTSSVEGFQSALEMESAERKTADSKISQSIGSQVDILKGYIGSSSNSNIADGTLRGAIGNTSIAGIGSENNITSAISSLNSDILNTYTKKEADELLIRKADIGHSHNDLYYTKAEIDASEKINSMALTTGIDITDSNNVITLSVNWSCSGVVAGHGYQRGKLKGVNAPTSYVFGTLLIVDANYNFKGNAIIFVDTSGYVTIVSQITHNESYSYRGSLTYVQR